MISEAEKVKIAHANGYRKGFAAGQMDGWGRAHREILRHLEAILGWEKRKRPQPPRTFCWNCLRGIKRYQTKTK